MQFKQKFDKTLKLVTNKRTTEDWWQFKDAKMTYNGQVDAKGNRKGFGRMEREDGAIYEGFWS